MELEEDKKKVKQQKLGKDASPFQLAPVDTFQNDDPDISLRAAPQASVDDVDDDLVQAAVMAKSDKRRGTAKQTRTQKKDAELLPEIHENKSKSLWPGMTLSNFAQLGD